MELRDKDGLTEQEFLASYNPGNFPRPSMTADIAIFSRDQRGWKVLLVRRGGHPCLGQWAMPGGFVGPKETIGRAAARELEEETGITGLVPEQLFTYSQPGRDPRTWVMTTAHLVVADASQLKVQAGDDAADAGWFRIERRREDEGVYSLRLEKGGELLTAKVLRTTACDDGPYRIMENSGLAFDHAKILALALDRLEERK